MTCDYQVVLANHQESIVCFENHKKIQAASVLSGQDYLLTTVFQVLVNIFVQ